MQWTWDKKHWERFNYWMNWRYFFNYCSMCTFGWFAGTKIIHTISQNIQYNLWTLPSKLKQKRLLLLCFSWLFVLLPPWMTELHIQNTNINEMRLFVLWFIVCFGRRITEFYIVTRQLKWHILLFFNIEFKCNSFVREEAYDWLRDGYVV